MGLFIFVYRCDKGMSIETAFLEVLKKDIAAYTKDVQEEIRQTIDKRTSEMCNEIKTGSPVRQHTDYLRQHRYAPGSFQKGWRVVVLRDDNGKYLKAAVENSNQKPLVHLLDQGHRIVTRNAARVEKGRVQGTEQVKRAQEKYTALVQDDIKRIINK